jgi:hypothetical protein
MVSWGIFYIAFILLCIVCIHVVYEFRLPHYFGDLWLAHIGSDRYLLWGIEAPQSNVTYLVYSLVRCDVFILHLHLWNNRFI